MHVARPVRSSFWANGSAAMAIWLEYCRCKVAAKYYLKRLEDRQFLERTGVRGSQRRTLLLADMSALRMSR